VNEAPHTGGGGRIKRDPRQFWVQLEAVVRHTDRVEDRVDAACRDRRALRVTEIRYTVLHERFIGSKVAPQSLLGAADNSKCDAVLGELGSKRFTHAAGRSKDRLSHVGLSCLAHPI
jgi:hypothetical protein